MLWGVVTAEPGHIGHLNDDVETVADKSQGDRDNEPMGPHGREAERAQVSNAQAECDKKSADPDKAPGSRTDHTKENGIVRQKKAQEQCEAEQNA